MTTPEEASSAHAMPCGRIDSATGQPCGIRVLRPPMTIEVLEMIDARYGPRPCPKHAGPNDRALAEVIDSVWGVGYNYGVLVKAGRAPSPARAHAPAAAESEAIPHGPVDSAPRERDLRGRQLVMIPGGYTYHWSDPHGEGDLHPGDVVLLPPNAVNPKPHEGVIESVGSSYAGATKAVLYLVRRA